MKIRSWLVVCAWGLCAASIAAAQSSYHQVVVPNGGSVSGVVRLQGSPPPEITEPVTKDGDYCGPVKTSPRLLVGRDGVVKNAVVWIDNISEGKKLPSHGAVTLRQKKCEYEPHVLLLCAGEEFEIVNDDAVLHNVHAYDLAAGSRSMFNIAQPVRGTRTKINPEHVKGKTPIITTCDAGHPWMNAYVIRASHPYYAVTDGAGRYRLDDIPPGTYTLRMWHEGVATRPTRAGFAPVVEEPYESSKQIVIPPYGTVTTDYSFSLRTTSASR
jgi:plastocyanin